MSSLEEIDFSSVLPPMSDEALEAEKRLERTISIVVPMFFSVIGFIGFVGNILVIITVLFNVQMRNTTNLLILNLSLADLLFIIFCIPFTAVDYSFGQWPFGLLWCKIVQYLIVVTAYISIYTLVLMSMDRFLAVCYPVSRIRSERNTLISIIVLWAAVLSTNLPVFHAHGLNEYLDQGRNLTSCTFITNNDFLSWSAFHISLFTSSYLLPLLLISVLYLFMLMRLWKSNLTQSKESRRGKRRVTRLVIVVVACFALLWLPIQTILLLKSLQLYHSDTHLTIALQISAHCLAYTTCCINPLLYAFLSENFRKSFRKIVYCGSSNPRNRHNNHQPMVPTSTKVTRTSF
ncbi:CLUMA_CG011189, isoform A [Clunio marinus]|uniref:CLUMA_CG011189, isoform A n=1 Tax=Clunio marinus TaxID=568069 RepID=A0A1J1IC07_9DIPT|nr:CLUMA_CG011189, isoform A [Clunio marinus]